ncbi:DNA-binding PadR family transcriptional regulator [Mumia flava]|uniref:DNA-binding PadR family transcriptional regulator n=1 Tax=Mumia flava TaxID=1348852 RepID=A0A2M9BG61_9ACTN|nr:PadR family transcriptional regulator [Mumia flava]PJJ56943.1 DNA-binding PadR family transcriptional regulator [Mumia flava]
MRTTEFDTPFGPRSGPKTRRRDHRGHGRGRGRGPGGPGFGPGGAPFGGPEFGAPGFGGRRRGGPRARRGDVLLAVLSVLGDEPTNGYGVIGAVAERTDGRWRPSPGSIYPVLRRLEEGDLVMSDEDGTFSLTESGRAFLADRADDVAKVWASTEPSSQAAEDLHSGIRKLARAARQVAEDGTDDQRARAAEALDEARKTLYGILAE